MTLTTLSTITLVPELGCTCGARRILPPEEHLESCNWRKFAEAQELQDYLDRQYESDQ